MYSALSTTSVTLQEWLESRLAADAELSSFFSTGGAGSMVVSLNTPTEMEEQDIEGVSIWLYCLMRDEQRLNQPPQRVSETQVRKVPFPARLHYLITPIINTSESVYGPELEQKVLGKILQVFHDHPSLRGADLSGDFSGSDIELHSRLEPMALEEITRVWDALDSSYQLCVSYEVSVVEIRTGEQPHPVTPVDEVLADTGVIVGEDS